MNPANRDKGKGNRGALFGRVTFYGITLALLGLLLWARFIIVTGHPRTAIADPAETRTSQADAGGETERR